MQELSILWAVEWSDEQRCVHVGLLTECLRTSREAFLRGLPLNYAIVGVFSKENDARQFATKLQAIRNAANQSQPQS